MQKQLVPHTPQMRKTVSFAESGGSVYAKTLEPAAVPRSPASKSFAMAGSSLGSCRGKNAKDAKAIRGNTVHVIVAATATAEWTRKLKIAITKPIALRIERATSVRFMDVSGDVMRTSRGRGKAGSAPWNSIMLLIGPLP